MVEGSLLAKTSQIRPVVSIQCRLVTYTDRQTDTRRQLIPPWHGVAQVNLNVYSVLLDSRDIGSNY